MRMLRTRRTTVVVVLAAAASLLLQVGPAAAGHVPYVTDVTVVADDVTIAGERVAFSYEAESVRPLATVSFTWVREDPDGVELDSHEEVLTDPPLRGEGLWTVTADLHGGPWTLETVRLEDVDGAWSQIGHFTYRDSHGDDGTGAPWWVWGDWPSDVVVATCADGRFLDVCDDHLFFGPIEALAATGITKGCNPPANDLYCAPSSVTRGQMAAFLVRALDLPAGSATFDDVPADHLFAADIAALADAGVTRGCDAAGTVFCPDATVTRGQMAAFLVRALDLPAGSATFDDVPADHLFAADIAALADNGVTRGCNAAGTVFCPGNDVSRGQMAAFLDRAGLTG